MSNESLSDIRSIQLRLFALLVVAIGCARSDNTGASTKVADTYTVNGASAATSLAPSIEPELTPAMLRALNVYAPHFERFAASEYGQHTDTTYRADGDFNGDAIPDLALYGHDKTRELLLVLLSEADSTYRVVPISTSKLEPFQNGVSIYLNTEPPGPVDIPAEFKKTLEPKPPDRLAYAAINVFYDSEASVLYYWNGKEFIKVITGD